MLHLLVTATCTAIGFTLALSQQTCDSATEFDKPLATSGFRYRDETTDTLIWESELLSISFNARSKFQHIQVIDTAAFGTSLLLDSSTQSTARDEWIYHESLVHPAMLAVGWSLGSAGDFPAKRAFIGGGGELATARELLHHASLEEVVMVELDKMVVDTSLAHLPTWSDGYFHDSRLKLHYSDAFAWLNRSDAETGTFDIIVMDIADPVEAGPGVQLYTREFYQLAKRKLRPGGVFVTQAGPAGLLNHKDCFTAISKTLSTVFDHSLPYTADVPSFGSSWGFTLAFDASAALGSSLTDHELKLSGQTFVEILSEELRARLESRTNTSRLKHFDEITHRSMFSLPKYLRQALAAEDRLITRASPVYTH